MLYIFQNMILILYLEYGVLSVSRYAILSFILLWSLVSAGTDMPYLLDGYGVLGKFGLFFFIDQSIRYGVSLMWIWCILQSQEMREFDILTKIPDCVYEAMVGLIDHEEICMGNNKIKTSVGTLSFTNERVLKLMRLLNDKPGSTAHASMAGHHANQVLKFLKNSLNLSNIDHNSPCEVCHKAKQTRDSFPLSDDKSVCFGKLVHLEVWGPYKVVSIECFRMPPKKMSTFESPAMTQAAIRKVVVNSVTTALEAQAATMANADNTNRNPG
uniref:Ribonuclease H-like domain-containing protein n=1 Tax=Tanacetum cinerariifolium TaxID=118510 RepID=A0A6L2LA04_TANCI|nr:ribonuclease H-like domain-containing protein [Tanacetum cinerariifolium]